MKLKLDENLGRRGAEVLRQAGHDVTTVSEQRMCSSSDTELIAAGQAEGRGLVTLDKEFGNPLVYRPSDYAGIALLRLPPKPTPDDLTECLQALGDRLARAEMKTKLWIVQRGRVREYTPADEQSEESES